MIRRLLACSLLCLTAQTPIQLGETNPLGYLDNGNANLLLAQGPYGLLETAVLQSLSFYVVKPAGTLYLGIYTSGPKNNCTGGTLVGETAAFATKGNSWNTQPVLSKNTLAPGGYCLAYLPSSNSLSFRKGGINDPPEVNYRWQFDAGLPTQFAANPCCGDSFHWMFYATLIPGPPTLMISFSPAAPTIAANAASGTVVATVEVTWSDGAPFTGTLAFGSPGNAAFALKSNQIVVANAAALAKEIGIQNVSVVATQ